MYICDSQIVHHIPCFNLFILHSNQFDNQGSEINKNDVLLRFGTCLPHHHNGLVATCRL